MVGGVFVCLCERSLTAGYQNTLSSSVIANKGFIAQFKDPGAKKLNPTHVSTFGGLFRWDPFIFAMRLQVS